ncbi:MAG TPA: iron-containing alcohol dehydrogenase [Verrucomicrobiae bacterium]|jgi:alcohol dehydrogenase|nr:iron-containing alcohol dehydrogenase [Verrucomicrobiae bacterium]
MSLTNLESRNAAPASMPAVPLGSLADFDHQPGVRLIFGAGSSMRAGQLARDYGARHVLLVTDPGIVAAGHAGRIQGYLEAAGLDVSIFDQADQNPTNGTIDRCLAVARGPKVDFIIGLGGGSAMDTAKGCNFIFTNGGSIQDYWGHGKASKPMLPFIAIPTTAGTGSECQSFALIADERTHVKMACGDPKAAAKLAILDPELTLSQPRGVTACTGIDTITHAVESAVTKKRNALSLMYAHEALKLSIASFHEVLETPRDVEARSRMQLAAAFAGIAIENSMLGAAHSAANPLTAHYGTIHGIAVGLMLPHVVRFNSEDESARRAYAELASAPELACVSDGEEYAVESLVRRIEALLNLADMPRSLVECGVKQADIPRLAEEAARQWTASFNPRNVTIRDFIGLYEAAMEPRESHTL